MKVQVKVEEGVMDVEMVWFASTEGLSKEEGST